MDVGAIVVIGLIALGVVTRLVVSGVRQLREERKRMVLERFREIAWPSVQLYPSGPMTARGTGACDQRWFQVELTAPAKYPMRLWLRLPVEIRRAAQDIVFRRGAVSGVRGKVGISFRLDTRTDRIARALGLTRKVKTGDSAFDARVVLDTDAPEEVITAIAGNEAARSAVLRLLQAGIDRIDLLIARPEITAVRKGPTEEHASNLIGLARDLATIADALPVFAGDPVERRGGLHGMHLPFALSAVCGALGFLAYFVVADVQFVDPNVIGRMVLLGVVVWPAACVIAYLAFRGRNRGLQNLLFAIPTLLMGAVGICIAGGHSLNVVLDRGPESTFDVKVLDAHKSVSHDDEGRDTSTYHAELAPLRPGEKPLDLRVTAAQFALVNVGSSIRVVTRPGGIGWERVTDLRRVPVE